jgi:hypothetical protein
VTRLATTTVALALAAAASGCLDFTDDEGPVMSVELFWDERPDGSGFLGGTCQSADVADMRWRLVRSDNGDVVVDREEPCANGIDIIDPAPGDYELKLTGLDADGKKVWGTTCVGLTVLRFDMGYECDICDLAHPDACGD